jgi:4,5-DOPA dioxygenase extradiol
MPALFIGHGSPMNAIEDTRYSRAWKTMAQALPRPRAILVVSAHWFVAGTAVTATGQPRTIHDFGGFPRALYEIRYPAPGDPKLAADIAELLAPLPVRLDSSWGLDHGAWSILVHAYPKADIPVLELSIDDGKMPRDHFEIGRRLAPLRDRGVLVMGTGNVVHNLERMEVGAPATFDWTVRFDEYIKSALEARDDEAVINYRTAPDSTLAAPDADHFFPLLYIAGIRRQDDGIKWLVEGYEAGSLSMRSFQVG